MAQRPISQCFCIILFIFIVDYFAVAQAKPTWTFRVVVAVEKQTADYFQSAYGKPITLIVNEQLARVNANFNSSPNFNGIYNFQADSIYVFDGAAQNEVFRPLTNFDYRIVINGFSDNSLGGGWWGDYHTIYHSWTWDFFNGPFGDYATDGLTHEFGHARGAIDLYALQVDASKNPINGTSFSPVSSVMNYPYGNIIWDEHTTNILNTTGGTPIVGEQYITSAFPNHMSVKAIDAQGQRLENVKLDLYPVEWHSSAVNATALLSAYTNDSGRYEFPNNPYQPATRGYPWYIRYCNFLLKATYNSVSVYQWLPLYDVQNAFFRNGPNTPYEVTVQFPADMPTITITSISDTTMCPGTTLSVSYTVSGTYAADNVFWLSIIDPNDNSFIIASLNGTGNGLLSGTVPYIGESYSSYKVRIIGNKPTSQSTYRLIHIKPAPSPIVQSVTVCQNSSPPALQATGQNLLWYTTASGGTGSPIAPIPATSQLGRFPYYVSQTVDGCESSRTSLWVTVVQPYTLKSGQWNDPSIWSCNQIPNSSEEVILSVGHTITVSGLSATARRITYGRGAKLVISTEGRLVIGNAGSNN